jgi:hypothetical protein
MVTNEIYLFNCDENKIYYVKKQYLVYSNPRKEITSVYGGKDFSLYTGYWDFNYEEGIKLIWIGISNFKDEHYQEWDVAKEEEEEAVKKVLQVMKSSERESLPNSLKKIGPS